MRMRRSAPSLIVVLAVVALNAAISVRGLWPGTAAGLADAVVRSDVKGYYGYLQALFIRHDLGHEKAVWEYVRHTPTGTLNKYYCGTAVMMAPWFLIGHDLALSDPKAPHDGLSDYEMKALSVGAWCYLLIGLLAMRALLRRMGFTESTVTWILIAIGFGTQLMQYSALQPGWSHVYSFCAVSAFLLAVHRFGTDGAPWWIIAAASLFGLIVIIRPVNGLVVLALPVVLGGAWCDAAKRAIRHPMVLMFAVIACGAVVLIQPLLWHVQIGKWYAYGYTGEGFHWGRPEVLKVLFGFRRGLFLWAPVLLVALFGTARLLLKDRARGIGMLLYWAANLYVISAWWIWYYGSGFGSRVFIEHLAVLAVPWALALHHAGRRSWIVARAWMLGCILLHGFQYWQYHHLILHHENMDRHTYAWAFGRTAPADRDRLGGNYQAPPFHPNGMSMVLRAYTNLEEPSPHWIGGRIEPRAEAVSGRHVCVYDGDGSGITFIAPGGTLPIGRALQLEVTAMRYEERAGDSFTMQGEAIILGPDGLVVFEEPFRMNPLPGESDSTWARLCYAIPLPPLQYGEEVRFRFRDPAREARVLLDDLRIKVFAVEPY